MLEAAGEVSQRQHGQDEELGARNSIAYYRSREQHVRSLAQSAISAEIASIHLEMAAKYAHLASELASRD